MTFRVIQGGNTGLSNASTAVLSVVPFLAGGPGETLYDPEGYIVFEDEAGHPVLSFNGKMTNQFVLDVGDAVEECGIGDDFEITETAHRTVVTLREASVEQAERFHSAMFYRILKANSVKLNFQ